MIGSRATELAFFVAMASVAWSGAYAWVKWLPHRHAALKVSARGTSALTVARLELLEAHVKALTLEVERMAESHRHAARLPEERLPQSLSTAAHAESSRAGRVVTPH